MSALPPNDTNLKIRSQDQHLRPPVLGHYTDFFLSVAFHALVSFVHLYSHQLFLKCLLYVRHCVWFWGK